MKKLFFVACLAWLCMEANAAVAFNRAQSPTGGLMLSSWADPNGTDADAYAYDDFTIPFDAAMNEVRWRGGYLVGMFGRATNFTIYFYESIGGGTQPHVNNPQLPEVYLARYNVGGNAGETAAGTIGGTAMYDYSFVLPQPFPATAGVKYWMRIQASMPSYPDWGIAAGTGGDGQYYRFQTGFAKFDAPSGDLAFTLLAASVPTWAIQASAAPLDGGTIQGAGAYTVGFPVVLVATPNAGFGFVNWTENNVAVSPAASYSFTASGNRTLVANFALNSSAKLTAVRTTTNTVVVAWPAPAVGFELQQNRDVVVTNWIKSPAPVEAINGQNQAIIAPTNNRGFYRLVRP